MAPSPEDHIIKLKLDLQKLEREREALSARIAAKRAELYNAKKAQQVRTHLCSLSQHCPSLLAANLSTGKCGFRESTSKSTATSYRSAKEERTFATPKRLAYQTVIAATYGFFEGEDVGAESAAELVMFRKCEIA